MSLSHTDRYRVVLNLFSRATNCSYVKAVLALRGLPSLDPFSLDRFRFDFEVTLLLCSSASVPHASWSAISELFSSSPGEIIRTSFTCSSAVDMIQAADRT